MNNNYINIKIIYILLIIFWDLIKTIRLLT